MYCCLYCRLYARAANDYDMRASASGRGPHGSVPVDNDQVGQAFTLFRGFSYFVVVKRSSLYALALGRAFVGDQPSQAASADLYVMINCTRDACMQMRGQEMLGPNCSAASAKSTIVLHLSPLSLQRKDPALP